MIQESDFGLYSAKLTDYIRRRANDWEGTSAARNEFNQLSLNLFRLQFESVSPYRFFCQNRGCDPSRLVRWEDIPALPAVAFKESEITSLPEELRTHVFHSSGTTGREAARHHHNRQTLELYEASLLHWFEAHLLPSGAEESATLRLVSLTPPARLAPNSSLVHMFEAVARTFPWASHQFTATVDSGGNWRLDLPAIEELLKLASCDGCPVVLLGTAFSYVNLLDFLENHGQQFLLPPKSRALETGGYKGKSREMPKLDLHAWMRHRLGLTECQIVGEYGMSELSSQAYGHVAGGNDRGPASRRFKFPPWARARVFSPETGLEAAPGEAGLLTILDLANVRSCLAIQTEDLAAAEPDGFRILGRAPQAQPRGCSLMSA